MMIKSICGIALHWCKADRIRVTQRHGQLLQLSVPSFVIIAGKTLEIIAAHPDHERHQTVYDCEHEGQPSRLRVQFTELGHPPAVDWIYGNRRMRCAGNEIEWFTPIRGANSHAQRPQRVFFPAQE